MTTSYQEVEKVQYLKLYVGYIPFQKVDLVYLEEIIVSGIYK